MSETMKREDNPCTRDCPKRNSRCHIDCPDYIKWHEKRAEELKAIYEQKNLERNLVNYEVERKAKLTKRICHK
jgi:hypothetical protein